MCRLTSSMATFLIVFWEQIFQSSKLRVKTFGLLLLGAWDPGSNPTQDMDIMDPLITINCYDDSNVLDIILWRFNLRGLSFHNNDNVYFIDKIFDYLEKLGKFDKFAKSFSLAKQVRILVFFTFFSFI